MEFQLKLALLGFVAGSVSASTGIGWGVITVPVLLLVLRVAPKDAVALSVLASLGYLLSSWMHRYAYGVVAWNATLALGLGSFVGGMVGVATIGILPDLAIKRIIGVMTIIAGVVLLLPSKG